MSSNRCRYVHVVSKAGFKNPVFLKKPNPVVLGGFGGFIGFFAQAGKIGKIIQKLSK